jgi:hypothetical protein
MNTNLFLLGTGVLFTSLGAFNYYLDNKKAFEKVSKEKLQIELNKDSIQDVLTNTRKSYYDVKDSLKESINNNDMLIHLNNSLLFKEKEYKKEIRFLRRTINKIK